jgi:hypothetical protein
MVLIPKHGFKPEVDGLAGELAKMIDRLEIAAGIHYSS